MGEGRRPRELHLGADAAEILGLQKADRLPRRQLVAPRLHGGVLHVLGELGEDELRVAGRRREGLHLLDGVVALFLLGVEPHDHAPVQLLPGLVERLAEARLDPFLVAPGELQRRGDAELGEIGGRLRPDAPDLLHRHAAEELVDVTPGDDRQPRRLLPLRGDLGDGLVGREPGGEGEAEGRVQLLLHGRGDAPGSPSAAAAACR